MADEFRVVYLKSVKERTQEGFLHFRDLGREQEFIDAAALIDTELRASPRQFGDPCFSHPQLHLDVFVRAVHPLLIYYAVHQTEAVVLVHRLEVLGD